MVKRTLGMLFGFSIMCGLGFISYKVVIGDIPLKEKVNVPEAIEYVDNYTWGERGDRFKGVPLIEGSMGEDSIYELAVREGE